MSERSNVARLIRVLCVFVVIPTLTIGGALLADPQSRNDHLLHAPGFAILAVVAAIAFLQAPRLAARFVPENA